MLLAPGFLRGGRVEERSCKEREVFWFVQASRSSSQTLMNAVKTRSSSKARAVTGTGDFQLVGGWSREGQVSDRSAACLQSGDLWSHSLSNCQDFVDLFVFQKKKESVTSLGIKEPRLMYV